MNLSDDALAVCEAQPTFLGNDKVYDHGGSSGQGSLGPDVEVVDGVGSHEGHLAVSVSVDATGDHQLATGIWTTWNVILSNLILSNLS